jgi:TolB-like protein
VAGRELSRCGCTTRDMVARSRPVRLQSILIFLEIGLILLELDLCGNSIRSNTAETRRVLYLFECYALDTDRRQLRCAEHRVPLEPQVFDLLTHLIENRARVVSKDDLLASVWGGRSVSESTLTSRINSARRAVGDSGAQQRLIQTLPRKGVRFVGAVQEQPRPATVESWRRPQLSDRPYVAVLPFQNLSADPEQEYVADGIVEEIITALYRFPSLSVVARNSSFTYKGRGVDVRQVGLELGVRYVLEGSVRRAGNRVTAPLGLRSPWVMTPTWVTQWALCSTSLRLSSP